MRIKIITLFPEVFPGTLQVSLLGKALHKGSFSLELINLRDYATDVHKTVDDAPYAGGPGMLLKADVLGKAITHTLADMNANCYKLYTSARGQFFTQELAKTLSLTPDILIVCGRYEGIDQRIIDYFKLEEVSIGPFILCGGEVAALAMLEAIIRLLPATVGNPASIDSESYSMQYEAEHDQYTRPFTWNDMTVPEVLVSGNHRLIEAWKKQNAGDIRTRFKKISK